MNNPHSLPTSPAPALDEQALERLRQLDPDGRHGVLVRILRAYEASVQTAMEQIAAAAPRGDLRTVGELAHKLKSSSASIGALAMAACCEDVETRLREGQPFDAGADVENLLAEAGRALQAVRAMLPPQVPS